MDNNQIEVIHDTDKLTSFLDYNSDLMEILYQKTLYFWKIV